VRVAVKEGDDPVVNKVWHIDEVIADFVGLNDQRQDDFGVYLFS